MNNRLGLIAIAFVFVITTCCGEAAGEAPSLTAKMTWRTKDGKTNEKTFPAVNIDRVKGRGLWVAFETKGKQHFPGICFEGKFEALDTPTNRMTSLCLKLTLNTKAGKLSREYVIFSKTRAFGYKVATPENVYHVLVLDDFVVRKPTLAAVNPKSVPNEKWAAPFTRTRQLAMNYAAQSDAKTREYEGVFKVKARYDLPRMVLVAEEWLDIPKEVVEKKKKAAGPWGALNDLSDQMEGKKKIVSQKIPTYTLDVLHDAVEAKGQYTIGFQASRSMWNDVLEAKVIYEATARKRRILTASILFSQMQKNIATRKSGNRILRVDAKNTKLLETCEHLWPTVKKEIAAFVANNAQWQVLIPAKPVIFYQDGKPIFATYAWFRVHPASGRMVGVLPNGARGAKTPEDLILGSGLLDKMRDKVVDAAGGGPVKGFFSQVAGLYVGAAGIIDGIAMTIADPSLAEMGGKEWRKFLAMHALDVAQKFLEDNAGQYDSYAAQLGFWQGAVVWPLMLGGPDIAKEAARRAMEGVAEQAKKDAEAYVKNEIKDGKKLVNEAVNEALGEYAPRVRDMAEGLNTVKEHYDKGAKWGTDAAEAVNQFNETVNELRNR